MGLLTLHAAIEYRNALTHLVMYPQSVQDR